MTCETKLQPVSRGEQISMPFPPLTFRACPLAQHHQHGSGRAQPQLRSVSAEGVGSASAAQNQTEFCCFGFNAASDVLPTITTWRTTCSTAGSSLGAAQAGWSCALHCLLQPCTRPVLFACPRVPPASTRVSDGHAKQNQALNILLSGFDHHQFALANDQH